MVEYIFLTNVTTNAGLQELEEQMNQYAAEGFRFRKTIFNPGMTTNIGRMIVLMEHEYSVEPGSRAKALEVPSFNAEDFGDFLARLSADVKADADAITKAATSA